MPYHINSKLFFIHIPKTGGSTFEKVIKDYYNTPWSYWGKIHNLERYRQIFPNKEDIKRLDPDRNYMEKDSLSLQTVYHHLTFRDIEKTYDTNNLYSGGVKFIAILRNPFDRLVSFFHYGQMRGGLMNTLDKTFEEWFYVRPVSCQSRQFLIDKNNIIPEYIHIIDFNNYEDQVCKFFNSQSIAIDSLPVTKKSNHTHWKNYYSSKMIKELESECAEDISLIKSLGFSLD